MGNRRSKPIQVGEVLAKVMKDRDMGGNALVARLRGGWEAAVGKAVAAHASPEALNGGRLTVVVDGSAWMQQLSMLRPEIIDKVNHALGGGNVEDIRFRLGKVQGGEAAGKKAAPFKPGRRDLGPEEKAEVEESLRPIKDAEIRERARRLLTTAYSRKA